MKIVTFVRHARASWDYPELGDFERPLDARGGREASAMARRAQATGVRAERLITSPALRAITTARAFAQELGYPFAELFVWPELYESTPRRLLELLGNLEPRTGEVMLFGHNPAVSQAAQLLASCPFQDMPTCALARIGLTTDSWAALPSASGRLLAYEAPAAIL